MDPNRAFESDPSSPSSSINDDCKPELLCDIKQELDLPRPRKVKAKGAQSQPNRHEDNPKDFKKKNGLFSCHICQKKFTLKPSLKKHILMIHSRAGKFFSCDLCDDYKAVYEVSLKRHIKSKHGGEQLNKLPCIFCGQMMFDFTRLSDHLRTHTLEQPHFCKYCDKEFSLKSNLKRHLKTHSDERERLWNCGSCKKTFFTEYELKLHFRVVHRRERKHKCDICSKSYATASDLIRHKRSHTNKKPYKCKICAKCFQQPGGLKTHLKTHSTKRTHECEICGMMFKTKGNLRDHRFIHEPERRFICKVCGKPFQQRGSLLAHLKSHSANKAYKCEICNVSFTLSTNLTRHNRSPTHLANVKKGNATDKSSFSCKECGKCFSSGGMLQRHHSVAHLSESLKSHECDLCSKRFLTKLGLTQHLNSIHIGMRNKCPHCQQLFTSLTGMRTHIKRVCKVSKK